MMNAICENTNTVYFGVGGMGVRAVGGLCISQANVHDGHLS